MAGAERPRHSALALPGAALAFGALLVLVAGERILPAYLGAFVFWTGVSTGALALLLVHRLTGGAWGGPVEPVLLGALRALPVMAALAVPLLVAAPRLYPWAGAEADAFAAHWYLLPWFFVLRAVIYFVVWLALAHALHAAAAGRSRPPRRLAAGGLVLLALTVTLAAIDWIMSLDPHWFSAVFGLEVAAGQVVAALAFAIVWRLGPAPAPAVPPERRHDLGGLLLAVALLWAYLAFMQLVTVWIANLPAEIRWYLPRLDTAWRFLGGAVIALHLALPVPLLLVRAAKRSAVGLGLAAALMLAGQAAHALWLVLPGHTGAGGFFAAAALLAAFGGLWLAALGRPPATERTGFTASGTPSHG